MPKDSTDAIQAPTPYMFALKMTKQWYLTYQKLTKQLFYSQVNIVMTR